METMSENRINILNITLNGCGIYSSKHAASNHKNLTPHYLTANDFQIELPIENGGTITIDGVSRSVDTNTLVFLKPNNKRMTVPPLRCLFIHFSCENEELCQELYNISNYITLYSRSEIYDCLVEIIRLASTNPDHKQLFLSRNLTKLFTLIVKNQNANISDVSVSSNHISDAIINTANYISENLNENITLESLSKIAHLSPIYYQRLFTKITGKTPHQYLLDKRLKKACELLITSGYTLSKISTDCGFSSQSRFNVVFKQTFGMTPSEYKRKNEINSLLL